MLSSRCVPGAKVNVLNRSAAPLVEATTTQTTGSRQYTAPTSRTPVATGLTLRLRGRGRGRAARAAELLAVVSAVTVVTSLLLSEGARADQLQEAERQHKGCQGDDHGRRGRRVDVVPGEGVPIDLHERRPGRGDVVGERAQRHRLGEHLEGRDEREQ